MTRVMAREAAPYNVRVNAVCPGLIETDMTAEVSQFGGEIIPLGRSGKPEEVARVVTFLASDSARYMTGSHVVVDGGLGAAW
jgi:NAD(P)-dependent dehydrogenase (short-subunit alcohol dehydrogenase family)